MKIFRAFLVITALSILSVPLAMADLSPKDASYFVSFLESPEPLTADPVLPSFDTTVEFRLFKSDSIDYLPDILVLASSPDLSAGIEDFLLAQATKQKADNFRLNKVPWHS
jgi:hypothetical protein